jgi:uncharacterized membrane protein HdeD (DUF308 family)
MPHTRQEWIMSDLIRSAYRGTLWTLVLRGILALLVGVFILWRPLDSIGALALLIAWWSLFNGITQVVHALQLRTVLSRWWVLLLSGLVGIVFGIAALAYYPGLSLAFAVVWVTWWLLLTGAMALFAAFTERSHGLPWGWTAAFGALAMLAAIYGVMSPPATLAAILGLISGFAIVSGLLQLMGAFKLASMKQSLGDAIHGVAAD